MHQLDLSLIRTDPGTQARARLDMETVREYEEAIEENGRAWPFPPVIVYHDGTVHWLADGFHRVAAARRMLLETAPADVREGTRRDAILFAAGANADHGLKRSPADKRNAVRILLADEEWGGWSDREIARQCKVSHPFVAKVRQEVTGNVSSDNGEGEPEKRTYTTKHGTQTAVVYHPVRSLQVAIDGWLRFQADNTADRLAFIDGLKRVGRPHRLWDDMEAALPKPHRGTDVKQAINNVADIWRQKEEEQRVTARAVTIPRPTPPAGYILYNDKVNKCPACKQHGFVWNASEWQSEEAMMLQLEVKRLDEEWFASGRNGLRPDGNSKEFLELRDHWSRFSTGCCANCGTLLWHDFGAIGRNWHYYYKPASNPMAAQLDAIDIELEADYTAVLDEPDTPIQTHDTIPAAGYARLNVHANALAIAMSDLADADTTSYSRPVGEWVVSIRRATAAPSAEDLNLLTAVTPVYTALLAANGGQRRKAAAYLKNMGTDEPEEIAALFRELSRFVNTFKE